MIALYIIILTLYTFFFGYLDFLIYAWLNKAFPITKKMGWLLGAVMLILVFLHIFFPVKDPPIVNKLSGLFFFSCSIFLFYLFAKFAVPRVINGLSEEKRDSAFIGVFQQVALFLFLKLMPVIAFFMQVVEIWTADFGNY